MTTEQLEQAFAATRSVLENVKPDQYDDPTPCANWTVRDLINHIVTGSQWFAVSTNAGEAPADFDYQVDHTQGDVLASFDQGIKASVEAFGAPGAQERIVKLPFGEFPGFAFMGLATTDTLTHGWDLAKATGQSTDLVPELAAGVLEGAKMAISDEIRSEDGAVFGPEQQAPAGASNADKLAAFLGRKV